MASTSCNITSFKITTGGSTYIGNIGTNSVAISVPFGTAVTALSPVVAISTGASVSPTSGTATNFTSPVTYTVTAADGTTTKAYTVTVTVLPDVMAEDVHNIPKPGWSSVRCVTGTLDSYTTGGVDLKVGSFNPKYVVGIQVGKGNTGYYDVSTKKLKVFSAAGTEISAASGINYTVTLMGE